MKSTWWAALLLAAMGTGSAQAALIARNLDGNAATAEGYYDNVLNVTWLADWNQASTSGLDADGLMSWNSAMAWAGGLVIGGHADWRLPGSSYWGCHGYNCASTAQELGHLFYATLGNSAGSLANPGPFQNVQMDWYWTGENISTTHAGLFAVSLGYLGDQAKTDQRFALAVHDGDIGGAVLVAVPEPGTPALVGIAALGAGLLMRRRRRG